MRRSSVRSKPTLRRLRVTNNIDAAESATAGERMRRNLSVTAALTVRARSAWQRHALAGALAATCPGQSRERGRKS
jgi:hypothetical protein